MAKESKTVEERIAEWQAQSPACVVMPAEREFIATMRGFASRGVGYGWMQTIIEWEWQSKHGGAWGPERFHEWLAEKGKFIATLAKLLEKREWDTGDGIERCAYCGNGRWAGHKFGCELSVALRAAEDSKE